MLKKIHPYFKTRIIATIDQWLHHFTRRKINPSTKMAALFDQLFAQACNDQTHYLPFEAHEPIKTDIRCIAFYLPQFHPIPENDQWWGKGFTEWTNVSKAVPQFIGHYQPHLPGELGFYDLRLIEIQRRQIELAKNYGIHGFCYHHYWFGGKKMLNQPFQTVLENKALDLPFCLCWANENWTRTWDGRDSQILLKQTHSEEDDIDFIKDIETALRDNRYIRINNRPLLIIYRADLLPNAAASIKRWRDYCIASGIGDLYLVATQCFDTDTLPKGFDALVEFPPNNMSSGPLLNAHLSFTNPNHAGRIYDYHYAVEKANAIKKPTYTLLRTVFPSWDNEARRPGRGLIYANSTPSLYNQWLRNAIAYTRQNNKEQLVFINAWNEWAEGAHLEPDRKYGYAWLQATYDAMC